MTGVTRVLVEALKPGDEARPSRTSTPYTVAAVAHRHGAWAVRGADGITRHYAATARVWRTDRCAGQGSLLDAVEGVAR